jgi:FkbM family methyltransferase
MSYYDYIEESECAGRRSPSPDAVNEAMQGMFRKILRTLQSYFGDLKPAKDRFYFIYRNIRRAPSQNHFKFLKLLPPDVGGLFVDVGGNIGQSVQAIRMFLPGVRIVSFEPNPNLARFISDCYRSDAKVEVRNVGLGERPGQFTLHVPTYRGFVYDALASFDREHAGSWLSADTLFFFNPEKLTISELACRVERLDDQSLDNVTFIKIDVEGFEAEVVKGGLETIRACHPILMIEDYHEKQDLKPILAGMGYLPFRFNAGKLEPGEADTSTFLITPGTLKAFGLDRCIVG